MSALAVDGRGLSRSFRSEDGSTICALDQVALHVQPGTLSALVGPDGDGKTTLFRLICGLLLADAGELTVLGTDVARDPQQVQSRIAYMPQRFGLYDDLSVQENLDLYADIHGVPAAQRAVRYGELMEMTALGPFVDRLAGQLSGGMKQKLGLACTLVRSPELLLLDEPTVGVDPLSRRELWTIIKRLVEHEHLSVLLSTSYLDEAERCSHVVVLHRGKVLCQGPPAQVSALAAGRTFIAVPGAGENARSMQARLLGDREVVDAVPDGGLVRIVRRLPGAAPAGQQPVAARFEDGFMVLLRQAMGDPPIGGDLAFEGAKLPAGGGLAVEVKGLVKLFGSFVAVDHVTFAVRRGEIFGLLGPNGAGKTTTFRMLCGLLASSGGTLQVAGADLRRAGAAARQRIGYVAQKFSLYATLSVHENLDFFASAYGLHGPERKRRIAWALHQFELSSHASVPSGQLAGGFKQRLAMAAALLHGPEILFLDEPTSGADPLARREFWRRITTLAEQGVTAIVTTHFMEEAEYCDHIAIMDAGRILAQGTPAELRQHARPVAGHEPSMEDAFIAIVEDARHASTAAQR